MASWKSNSEGLLSQRGVEVWGDVLVIGHELSDSFRMLDRLIGVVGK